MPSVANAPKALSRSYSQAMSSIRKPRSLGSFSSVISLMAPTLSLPTSSPWVGGWCTATPNRGVTSLVSLPSSFNHSLLLRANSTDAGSLNRITYPFSVVPIPVTCAFWVDAAFSSAVLMCVFAVG